MFSAKHCLPARYVCWSSHASMAIVQSCDANNTPMPCYEGCPLNITYAINEYSNVLLDRLSTECHACTHLDPRMSCTCQCQSHHCLQHRQRLQLCLCGDHCRKALAAGCLRAICSSSHELFCNSIKHMSFSARDYSTWVMQSKFDSSKQMVACRSALLQSKHNITSTS